MNELPELIIGPHGIENWDEVFHWAVNNDPLWHRCRQTYGYLSMKRFLETLTALQLRQNIETTKAAAEIAKKSLGWKFDWTQDQ